VLAEITSYQRGWVGRLGNLAGRILGRKFDLESAINRSLEFNQREPPPENQEHNKPPTKDPPLTVEKMEYLHPNTALKDIMNIAHEAIPPQHSPRQ